MRIFTSQPPALHKIFPDHLADRDGYVADLASSSWIDPRDACPRRPSGNNPDTYEGDADPIDRPSSRQSQYRNGSRYGSRCSRIPPLNVRRYPFVLDGHHGLYTLAHISRHADIAPRRGTAMQLRRFVLVNEYLDRRKAVGYQSHYTVPAACGGTGHGPSFNQSRWQGHGASKLRNEISLDDLTNDESDCELSFNSSSFDNSFGSKCSDDFEAPMEKSNFEEDIDELDDVLREYDREFQEFLEDAFRSLPECESDSEPESE